MLFTSLEAFELLPLVWIYFSPLIKRVVQISQRAMSSACANCFRMLHGSFAFRSLLAFQVILFFNPPKHETITMYASISLLTLTSQGRPLYGQNVGDVVEARVTWCHSSVTVNALSSTTWGNAAPKTAIQPTEHTNEHVAFSNISQWYVLPCFIDVQQRRVNYCIVHVDRPHPLGRCHNVDGVIDATYSIC